jgi:hypothetical protein
MSRKSAKNRVEAGGIEPEAPTPQVPENTSADVLDEAADTPRRPLTCDKSGGTVPPGGVSAVAAGDEIEPGAFEAATDDGEPCPYTRGDLARDHGGACPLCNCLPELHAPDGPDVGTDGAPRFTPAADMVPEGRSPTPGEVSRAFLEIVAAGCPFVLGDFAGRPWRHCPFCARPVTDHPAEKDVSWPYGVYGSPDALMRMLRPELSRGWRRFRTPFDPPAARRPRLPAGITVPPDSPLDGYELRIRLIDGEERHVETCWHFTCGCWLTVLELTGAVIRREPCGEHR